MIELLNKIYEVNLNLYGTPILKGIQDKQKNGNIDNIAIPFEFEYNGSWKITHMCSSCQSEITFGDRFDNLYVTRENYNVSKTLFSRYYNVSFLDSIAKVFSDLKLFKPNSSEYHFITPKDFNDPNVIDLFIPTKSIIYYNCFNCNAEYLCLFRQGFPMEPEPNNPRGRLGTIFIDEIINIKVKEGDSFLKLTETHRRK